MGITEWIMSPLAKGSFLEGVDREWIMSHFTVSTVLVAICSGYLAYRMVKKFRYRTPPGPFGIPLLGNVQLFTDKQIPRTLMKMADKLGPVIKIKMGPLEMYVLNTIEVALEALVKKGSDFANRTVTTTIADMSEGSKDIAMSNYTPTWKLHRKIASKALRHYLKGDQLQLAIDYSMTEIIKVISELKEAFEPTEYIDYIVFNILCSLCFKQGYTFDDPEFKRIMKIDNELLQDFGLGTLEDIFPILKKIGPTKKYKTMMGKLNEILFGFINVKLEEHKKTFDPDNIRDFADSLLLARQEAEQEEDPDQLSGLTDVHIRQTLADIFFAGIDTSRMTLQWTMLCLAKHSELQTKCQREIDEVVGRKNLPRLSDRPTIPYTEAFLMEVMRMYPVVGLGVPHAAMRDSSVHGYDAPKKTVLFINHYAILNDPRHWDRPEEFNPNRYLDKDGNMLPKPESWLPFSAGRRVCLGESVARPEILNIVATLIHQFEIKLPEGFDHDMEAVNALTVPIPKPFKLVMTKRL